MITEKTKAYTDKILELKAMERLSAEKRTGYMLSVKQVYNSLIKFNKHLNIYFPDIDMAWLRKYETWLRSNNIKENTAFNLKKMCAKMKKQTPNGENSGLKLLGLSEEHKKETVSLLNFDTASSLRTTPKYGD